MTRCVRRTRRGAALPAVLLALVVLGLLAAALATETRTAAGAASGTVAARRATDAAESALQDALRAWAAHEHDALAIGAAHDTTHAAAADLAVALRTTRLARAVYALDAEAGVQRAGGRLLARRHARLLVALDPLVELPGAAVTVAGPLVASAATRFDGTDTLPPGWRCNPADSVSVAALAHAPSSPPSLDGAALAGAEPHVRADAAATGDVRYRLPPAPRPPAFVAARARDTLAPPGAAALPLVHFAGDLVLAGTRRQGVLVVDGDLVLAGGAELWGVVIVGGRLVAHGPNRVVGALLAHGRAGTPHDVRGLSVRWSSCVADAALRAVGRVRPVTDRALTAGW